MSWISSCPLQCSVYLGSIYLFCFGPCTNILVILSLIIKKTESFTHEHLHRLVYRTFMCVCRFICTICPILIVKVNFGIIVYLKCSTVNYRNLVIYTFFGLNIFYIYMYNVIYCLWLLQPFQSLSIPYRIYRTHIWQETYLFCLFLLCPDLFVVIVVVVFEQKFHWKFSNYIQLKMEWQTDRMRITFWWPKKMFTRFSVFILSR